MGLDFSHTDAHWSYSGFGRFRNKLAKEIRMDLNSMEGFDGQVKFSDFNDDILPLLDHSDCDGDISPEDCKKVSPRLRELVSSWSDEDYDKQNALELADAMDLAASLNEPLEFI